MCKIIPWIVLFMLSSPDAGSFPLQACLAVSQDGSSANSEKESATDGGDDEITVGDVVHVLQGENHWHGATANSYMSHITITAAE